MDIKRCPHACRKKAVMLNVHAVPAAKSQILNACVCWGRVGKLWRSSSKTLTGFLENSCQCIIFLSNQDCLKGWRQDESCWIQCSETTNPAEPSRAPVVLLDSANLLQLLSLRPLDSIGVGQLWLKYLKIQRAFNTCSTCSLWAMSCEGSFYIVSECLQSNTGVLSWC